MTDKPKTAASCTFRPQGKGQELIEKAGKLGVNVSGILNQMLEKHGHAFFEPAFRERKKELRELLEVA
jgi:hypothetical protein